MDPDSKSRKTRTSPVNVSVPAPVSVFVTDGRGRGVSAPGLAAWLRRIAPASARGELSIALVSDQAIRTLNRTFRGTDHPTDVLTFRPDSASSARYAFPHTPQFGRTAQLGDIVIAKGVARRQARDAGHSYVTELKVLALHGLLHLLGYDHHDPADGGRMARVERALRRKGGLRAGLIERARPGRRR